MTRLIELGDPNLVLELEPEELAPIILRHLQQQQQKQQINRYNFSLVTDRALLEQLGKNVEAYAEKLMEAWMVLEREGFIAPQPGMQGDWAFVTSKGRKVASEQDFKAYGKTSLFPRWFDAVLTQMVKPLFIRGDYDTAVFRAFKEVEVRTRRAAGLSESDFGIDLMKKAFGPPGLLADTSAPRPEQERMRDLFVGAIGTYRPVHFDDPVEVLDVLSTANQLLRIVDRRAKPVAL
jgi:uncharacterized protein (TIGR02391 family)